MVRFRLSLRLRLEKKNMYEFHEMLLCETNMCFSEMIRCFWRYVKVYLEMRTVFLFSVEALL